MNNYYVLKNEAYIKHRNRIFQLLGAFAATALVTLILGLVRWSEGAYIGVNILLLAVAAAGIIFQTRLGGYLDGKPETLKKTITVGVAVGAAVLWLFMTITGLHYALSIVIFIVDVVLVVKLALSFKDIVKNCWNALMSPDPKNYEEMMGIRILLENVHTGNSLTSPVGKVFIGNHTVLFALTCNLDGFIQHNDDGSFQIRKRTLFNREKATYIDKDGIMRQAEEGAQRIHQIVEEGCKKRGISMPNMAFSYAMFLPNFAKDESFLLNVQDDLGRYPDGYQWYYNVPWDATWNSGKVQGNYTCDFFRGKACFRYKNIAGMLRAYDWQFQQANPDVVRDSKELDAMAQIIAEACELRPDTTYQKQFDKAQKEYYAQLMKEYNEIEAELASESTIG